MITVKTQAKAPAVAEKPKPSFWETLGGAWVVPGTHNGKQLISIKLNDGQRFVLRERLTKREGKRDPDFDFCLPA